MKILGGVLLVLGVMILVHVGMSIFMESVFFLRTHEAYSGFQSDIWEFLIAAPAGAGMVTTGILIRWGSN